MATPPPPPPLLNRQQLIEKTTQIPNKTSEIAVTRKLFGIAYGVLRGRCLIKDCFCDQYITKSGGGPCRNSSRICNHFPVEHVHMGKLNSGCVVEACRCMRFEAWPENTNFGSPPIDKNSNCHNCGHIKTQHTNPSDNWLICPNDIVIGKEIGSGRFGGVYMATFWGTTVAVKQVLANHIGQDQEEMIQNEIYILATLHHPNLITLVAACTDKKNFMIVTDYAANGSLASILWSDKKNFTYKDTIRFSTDIALGMNYLHHKNILHRDLKTDNILVSAEWRCKVSDFGLSTILTANTRRARYGSPFWMAPEIINKQVYSKSADVYSYSIILSELVTRNYPYSNYEEKDEDMVMRNVLFNKMRPELPSWVPEIYQKFCGECWDHEPSNRPSFDTILEKLNQIWEETKTMENKEIQKTVVESLQPSVIVPEVELNIPYISMQTSAPKNPPQKQRDPKGQALMINQRSEMTKKVKFLIQYQDLTGFWEVSPFLEIFPEAKDLLSIPRISGTFHTTCLAILTIQFVFFRFSELGKVAKTQTLVTHQKDKTQLVSQVENISRDYVATLQASIEEAGMRSYYVVEQRDCPGVLWREKGVEYLAQVVGNWEEEFEMCRGLWEVKLWERFPRLDEN